MQEVFSKIIEKLEELKSRYEYLYEKCNEASVIQYDLGRHDGILNAIEIVKQEAEKYDNGWIPCSERLPEKNGYYYVTQIVKSISTGKNIAIEKDYVEFSEGKWRRAKHLEVIAWIDIETYQPKGE